MPTNISASGCAENPDLVSNHAGFCLPNLDRHEIKPRVRKSGPDGAQVQAFNPAQQQCGNRVARPDAFESTLPSESKWWNITEADIRPGRRAPP